MDWSIDRDPFVSGSTWDDFGPVEPGEPDLAVHLPGRCLSHGWAEARCTLAAIRGHTGRVLAAALPLPEGARVIAYLDLVGRVEGVVTGTAHGAFLLRIAAPLAKWRRLAEQFEMLARLPRAAVDDLRGFRRIAPDHPETAVTGAGGTTVDARIENLSRSGAAVSIGGAGGAGAAWVDLGVGSLVRLGSTPARVVRHTEDGVAVQFLRLLPLESFGPSYRP